MWDGLVTIVTAVLVAAIVIGILAFVYLSKLLSQVGNWFATAAAAVKSAVAAAQKALSQLVDFVTLLIKVMVQNSIGPLFAGLSASAAQTQLSIQSTCPSAIDRYRLSGSIDSATLQMLVNTLLGSYVWTLLGLSAAVVAIGIALYPIAPIGLAIMTVAGAIAGALLFKAITGRDFALPATPLQPGIPNPFTSTSVFDFAVSYANEVSPGGNSDQREEDAALASIIFGAESAFVGLAVDPTGIALSLAGVVIAAGAAIIAGAATLPGASGLAILALGFAVVGVAASAIALAEAYLELDPGPIFAAWLTLDLSLGSIAFAVVSL